MRRTFFHMRGWIRSYIENSSKASPLLRQRRRIGLLALGQKLFNFNALRRSISAAEPVAFQRHSGGGESRRLPKLLVRGGRQIRSHTGMPMHRIRGGIFGALAAAIGARLHPASKQM